MGYEELVSSKKGLQIIYVVLVMYIIQLHNSIHNFKWDTL